MEEMRDFVTKKRFNSTLTTITLMILALTMGMTGRYDDNIEKWLLYIIIALLVISAIQTRVIINREEKAKSGS